MKTRGVKLQIDPAFIPFIREQAALYGYFSGADYLNGLLNRALYDELADADADLPHAVEPDHGAADLDDGIPI